MTKEEILAMNPGRELDVLVADKVLKFQFSTDGTALRHPVTKKAYFHPNNETDVYGDGFLLPSFSTDISAAWEVAEKMPTPFVILKSYQDQFGVGPLGWLVNWCDNDGECGCIYGETCINDKTVWALTAPEAICKAALLAVMEL